MSWISFSAWLHIHLASSYLCTQLYPFHIQQTFYRKKKKKKEMQCLPSTIVVDHASVKLNDHTAVGASIWECTQW